MTSEPSDAAGARSAETPNASDSADRAALQRQLEQLQALRDAGVLDEASFVRSRQIIDQRLSAASGAGASDVPGAASVAPAAAPAAVTRPRWRFPLVAAAVALAGGSAGYWLTGQSEALFGAVTPVDAPTGTAAGGVPAVGGTTPVALPLDSLAERLAQRLKNEPNDVDGWVLLGRSYVNLGRQAEAVAAFQRALSLRPGDADAKAGLAEAQSALSGAPTAMAGGAGLPAGTGSAAPSAPGASVAGIVTLSPDLLGAVKPEDTVFILARRVEGSRMPLAILRRQVRDLPVSFELDDSHGMSPADRLSAASTVVISARVSRSGQAAPQPGDLEGASKPVPLGQKNVVFEISRRLP